MRCLLALQPLVGEWCGLPRQWHVQQISHSGTQSRLRLQRATFLTGVLCCSVQATLRMHAADRGVRAQPQSRTYAVRCKLRFAVSWEAPHWQCMQPTEVCVHSPSQEHML